MEDYKSQLEARLKVLKARVRKGKVAQHIKANAADLIEILDAQRQLEIYKMTGGDPLSHEAYLESHGAVRAYSRVRDIIDQADQDVESASKEEAVVNGQLKQLRESEPAK